MNKVVIPEGYLGLFARSLSLKVSQYDGIEKEGERMNEQFREVLHTAVKFHNYLMKGDE